MQVRGPADFVVQPWANGRGQTVELARRDGPAGLVWRLSVATVAEDGPFSRLPGIWRSLTVIEGPGFRIAGEGVALRADPLVPVTFPGDAAVAACDVAGVSRDFNVMVAARFGAPRVAVRSGEGTLAGAAYALDPLVAGGQPVAAGWLVLGAAGVTVHGGRRLEVELPAP